MPELQVQVEEVSPVVCRLRVKVPADRVEQVAADICKRLARSVKLRGYRPGHVPRHVVEKHFADEVRSGTAREVMESTFVEALGRTKVVPVAPPVLDPGELVPGSDFDYAARVEVRPKVVLRTWKGLAVKVPAAKVSDEQVQGRLEQIREALATLVPVEGRDELQTGDVANVSWDVSVAGKPPQRNENANVRVEPGLFVEGRGGALAGMKPGEKREIVETFGPDTGDLAGREARIRVELLAIKRREVPVLDDELAKTTGVATLDELSAKVRADLEESVHEAVRRAREQAVVLKLIEENPMEVPPALVDNVARQLAAALLQQMMRLGLGDKPDEVAVDRLRADMLPRATFDVKRAFLLAAVADAEAVQATPEDLDAHLAKLAADERVPVEKLRARYAKAEAREGLQTTVRAGKALALVEASAQITVEGQA